MLRGAERCTSSLPLGNPCRLLSSGKLTIGLLAGFSIKDKPTILSPIDISVAFTYFGNNPYRIRLIHNSIKYCVLISKSRCEKLFCSYLVYNGVLQQRATKLMPPPCLDLGPIYYICQLRIPLHEFDQVLPSAKVYATIYLFVINVPQALFSYWGV